MGTRVTLLVLGGVGLVVAWRLFTPRELVSRSAPLGAVCVAPAPTGERQASFKFF